MALNRRWATVLGVLLAAFAVRAGAAARLERGVLLVDGKPFFPLGSWGGREVAPEEIARLGMNATFLMAPSAEAALGSARAYMRECRRHGVQVMQYVPWGWDSAAVRVAGQLAGEPNLLAWNVGDDVPLGGMEPLREVVRHLREAAPGTPTLADCIPSLGRLDSVRRTFAEFVDITMNYDYPIPDAEYPLGGNAFRRHQAFFDEQRAMFGDPRWTWTQTYLWHWTGQDLNVSPEAAGPYPEPEHVRLLVFSEINAGLRGLFCFSHREIALQPNLAAEIAVTFREIALFNDFLAAGEIRRSLTTSDTTLDATAFSYRGSTLVSLALLRERYQYWIGEGIARDVSVDVPWPGARLPNALLVATPDVIQCRVVRTDPGTVRVTIPSLELAGFVLVSGDSRELARVRSRVAAIPREVRTLLVPGAMAQVQKVNQVVWQSGACDMQNTTISWAPVQAVERCSRAIDERRYADGVTEWKTANRLCRVALDSVMRYAGARADQLTADERRHLLTPYGLHNIPALAFASPPGDRWRFVREWTVVGPFPLNRDWNDFDAVPEGFHTAYPPETSAERHGVFDCIAGPAEWRYARADLSGRLDFLQYFSPTENVLAYARCRVIVPRDTTVNFSIGSNDGIKVWANDELAFELPVPRGRKAVRHQNQFPVHLRAGENRILVKLTNLGSNWQLFCAVEDSAREFRFAPGW